jgi:transposase-like protein
MIMTAEIPTFATVQTEGRWNSKVVKAFLRDGGEHCPHCGSGEIRDAMESDASGRGWGILWACNACDEQWWNEYALRSYQICPPVKPKVGKRAYCKEPACPHCGADDSCFVYDTLESTPLHVEQPVRCDACQTTWVEINKLYDVTLPQEA